VGAARAVRAAERAMKRALILGGGTAGTIMANKLVEALGPHGWQVTAVDRDDVHIYQPGLLFIPFGMYTAEEVVRPRTRYFDPRVDLVLGEFTRVDLDAREVHLKGGRALPYDVLIVATGSEIRPEKTPGLTGAGWRDTAFDFYTLDGAVALREKLAGFTQGRLLLNVVEMPIKCPVAPLEFLFLAESFFRARGLRDKVEIAFATPLEGAFTKPLDQVRAVVLDQLQPQIQRADYRLAELRNLRLQGALLGWITDDLAALALAFCFAAIGQLKRGGSSLLLHVLHLPDFLRFRRGLGRRSRQPVDAAWLSSLHADQEDPGTPVPGQPPPVNRP
jgi:hypothetical protein